MKLLLIRSSFHPQHISVPQAVFLLKFPPSPVMSILTVYSPVFLRPVIVRELFPRISSFFIAHSFCFNVCLFHSIFFQICEIFVAFLICRPFNVFFSSQIVTNGLRILMGISRNWNGPTAGQELFRLAIVLVLVMKFLTVCIKGQQRVVHHSSNISRSR